MSPAGLDSVAGAAGLLRPDTAAESVVSVLPAAGVVPAPHALRMPAAASRASPLAGDEVVRRHGDLLRSERGRIVMMTPCNSGSAGRPVVIERRKGIANGSAVVGQLMAKHQAECRLWTDRRPLRAH